MKLGCQHTLYTGDIVMGIPCRTKFLYKLLSGEKRVINWYSSIGVCRDCGNTFDVLQDSRKFRVVREIELNCTSDTLARIVERQKRYGKRPKYAAFVQLKKEE